MTTTVLVNIHRPVFYFEYGISKTSYICRAQLNRFHLKTETESSLRNAVF
jgi:hypothetical protein